MNVLFNSVSKKIEVHFPWDITFATICRSIPTNNWNVAGKCFEFHRNYIELVEKKIPTYFVRETSFSNELAIFKAAKQATVQNTTTIISSFNFDDQFGDKKLFEHQKGGAKHVLDRKKSLLAMDLGTGKTLTSLVAMKATGLPIHVISPVSLQENWRNEALAANIRLAEIIPATSIKAPPTTPYALIVDEITYFQNINSKRTQKFLDYCYNATYLAMLSGTPMKNGKGSNLYPVLLAGDHPIAQDKDFYYTRYCSGKRGRKSKWVLKGASNLDELHENIKDFMFVKTKEECFDLPAKTRILVNAEMSAQEQGMFDFIFDTLRKNYFQRIKDGTIKDSNEALVILSQIRHACSWAKISTATRLCKELIEEGRFPVVFTSFKDSAAALHAQLLGLGSAGLLSSDVKVEDRNKMIADFQAGNLNSMVSTFGTGGIGITLTKSSDVILMDRPWTSADALQSEDRVYRYGQTLPVMAMWLQQHQVDKKIDAMLLEKHKNITEVLTGERTELEFNVDVRKNAGELLDGIFAR